MIEKLFRESPPEGWRATAIVGGAWTNEWMYVRGYIDAADALVDEAIERHQMDTFFYPICYLYRHAAEATIKELIRDTEDLVRLLVEAGEVPHTEERTRDDVEELLTKTHGLERLLNELERRIALVADEPLPEDCRHAVLLLHAEDPTGQRFRYSRIKGGSRKAPTSMRSFEDGQHIDLLHLRSVLSDALNSLHGGVGGWLSHRVEVVEEYLDQGRAIEAEMAAEAESAMEDYYGRVDDDDR